MRRILKIVILSSIACLLIKQAAEAAIAQANAARDLVRIDLRNTEVRAPIDGVMGNRQIRLGRYVTPGQARGLIFTT